MNSLAGVLYMNADFERAVSQFTEVLRIQRETGNASPMNIGRTLYNLGVATRRLGETESSVAYLDESEKLTIQSIGRDHVAVGIIMIALSESLLSLRRVDAAVQAARCAVTILEKGCRLPTGASRWRNWRLPMHFGGRGNRDGESAATRARTSGRASCVGAACSCQIERYRVTSWLRRGF